MCRWRDLWPVFNRTEEAVLEIVDDWTLDRGEKFIIETRCTLTVDERVEKKILLHNVRKTLYYIMQSPISDSQSRALFDYHYCCYNWFFFFFYRVHYFRAERKKKIRKIQTDNRSFIGSRLTRTRRWLTTTIDPNLEPRERLSILRSVLPGSRSVTRSSWKYNDKYAIYLNLKQKGKKKRALVEQQRNLSRVVYRMNRT